MSYVLTEDQKLLKNAVKEFVEEEAVPALVAQTQKDGSWDAALGLWPRLAEKGFIGIMCNEEMGGLGLGLTEEMVVLEELAVAGPIATNIDAHNLTLHAIEYGGNDYQKETWGIPGARGDIMFASAITDPAGSSNMPEWTIRVDKEGDDLIINGTKMFCTNSQAADVYAVAIKDYEHGYPMNFIMVEADTPGLEMGALEHCGTTGTMTGTVTLNNVRVPKVNQLPSGDFCNAPWTALGYMDCAIILCTGARGALDIAKEYVMNRSRNGKPLSDLQAVAHRIVNMEMKVEQVRTLIYAAAELWDAGTPDYKLHSMAKIRAGEILTEVSQECSYLLGGYGFAPGSGVYEIYCGATAGWVGEGPNDFHRDLIAGLLGMPQESWLSDPVR